MTRWSILAAAVGGAALFGHPVLEDAPRGPAEAAAGRSSETPPHHFDLPSVTSPTADALAASAAQAYGDVPFHQFYFTRAVYSSGRRGFRGWGRGRGGRDDWSTDYPEADRYFVMFLERLTNLDAYEYENAVRLDDPELRNFPFLYALEVGDMNLSEPEAEGLRDYLRAGGFLFIDDFWDFDEWDNFEREMARVFPDRVIQDVPLDHPLFSAFYDIDAIVQVPVVGSAVRGGPTWECRRLPCDPTVRGIFDDEGRLMVLINHNTDIGDAWEHADNPRYPLEYSTFAVEMGVNAVVYAMSH